MRHRLRGIAQEKKPLNYQISVADVHRPRPILIRNFYLEFPIQSFKKGVKYSRKKKTFKTMRSYDLFFFWLIWQLFFILHIIILRVLISKIFILFFVCTYVHAPARSDVKWTNLWIQYTFYITFHITVFKSAW